MVFRSHRPIFRRIDHATLSRIHSSDLSRSEKWDAQKGPNQREISMKPNALRWHFDRPSLHLRPHGVQRFFASASNLKLPLEVNGNAVRHKSLAGHDLTFDDIAGKLHMLRIECTHC